MNKLFYVLSVMLCMNMFAAEDKVVVQNKIFLSANKNFKVPSDLQWKQEMAEFDRVAAENDALFAKVHGKLASLTSAKTVCHAEPAVHAKSISQPGDDESFALTLESVVKQNDHLFKRTKTHLDNAFRAKTPMQKECDKAIAGIDRALAITQKMSRRQSQ